MRKRGMKAIGLSEIFILIVGTIAIAYAIGSEIKVVSGADIIDKPTYLANQQAEQSTQKIGSSPPATVGTPTSLTSVTPGPVGTATSTYTLSSPATGVDNLGNRVSSITKITATPNTASNGLNYKAFDASGKSYDITPDEAKSLGAVKVVKGSDIWQGSPQNSWYTTNNKGIVVSKFDPTQIQNNQPGITSSGAPVSYDVDKGGWVDANKNLIKNQEGVAGTSNRVQAPQILGTYQGYFLGNLWEGIVWAGAVVGALQLIGAFLPEEYKPYTNALTYAAAGGIMAGKLVQGIGEQRVSGGNNMGTSWFSKLLGTSKAGAWGFGIGVVVAAIIFYMMYKEESAEVVTFECMPWDAPTGGKYCEQCNKQSLPCSEYQCRSLGQSCELVNAGTTTEMCVWVNKNDVKFPTIEPWKDALLKDYEYAPDNTISPPDRGVKILNKKSADGCVPAFTPLTFGIVTDEPAQCKLDYKRTGKFDEMKYYFGGTNSYLYNHTQVMSLPGPTAINNETPIIQNNGEFSLYTRCIDKNGNDNKATFVFKFCVQKGADTTPPLIVTTNLLNGMPIAYNQSSLDIEVYVNEPATCKWSHINQAYDKMEETMSCSQSVTEINAQMLYTCKTKLTGLKNSVTNDFYFRCKDQPVAAEVDRNSNSESYKFVVKGTQPLVITSVSPDNETIRDATNSVNVTLEVKTSAGNNEGQAVCYYSDTGKTDSYIMFLNTNSYQHSQALYLPAGTYTYWVKCIDLGGNSDENKINFKVETDTQSPIVVRAFKEESYLRLITNEESDCVYDTVDCNYLFDDGTKMTASSDKKSQFTDWNTNANLYIKCEDKYGNQPLPNQCSIIVRPFVIYTEEETTA